MPSLERLSLLAPGSMTSLDDVEAAIIELDDKIESIEKQLLKPNPDDKWLARATYALRTTRAKRALFLVRQAQLWADYESELFMTIAKEMLPADTFAQIYARFEEAQA